MNLQDLITKYAGLIHRQSAAELKDNPVFMRHCRENAEFKQYVLGKKPTMATVKTPSVKFKRPEGIIVPVHAKPAQIEAETVEEMTKTAKIVKEVFQYGRDQGFLS